jgi:hypothetical protein
MIRTLRYLVIVVFSIAFLMLLAGFSNYNGSKGQEIGMSTLDHLSMANIVESGPVCMQQYVGIKEPR